MFDILGKLNPFEGEESTPAPANNKSASPLKSTPVVSSSVPPVNSYHNQGGQVNEEMVNHLRSVAFARNTSFKTVFESMRKLESVLPDVKIRAQAALATNVSGQRSHADILSALSTHVADLRLENDRFLAASTQKKASERSSLDVEKAKYSKEVSSIEKELQALEDKKAQLLQAKSDAEASALKVDVDLQSLDSKFSAIEYEANQAFNIVAAELEDLKQVFS